jgi:hypothetical protein
MPRYNITTINVAQKVFRKNKTMMHNSLLLKTNLANRQLQLVTTIS